MSRSLLLGIFRTAIGLAVLLLAMPSPLLAKRQSIQDWIDTLNANHQVLLSHNWDRAYETAETVVQELVDHIRFGSASLLGAAVLQKAVALEGQGKHDDACWYGHLAHGLSESAAPDKIAPYGAQVVGLAECLAPMKVTSPDEALDESEKSKKSTGQLPSAEIVALNGLNAPVKLSGKAPKFPRAGRRLGVQGPIIVGIVVDEHGVPIQPVVANGLNHPQFLYRAFEAVKTWRFKPAEVDGKPVAAFYTLAFNL